jgi:predicted DNA-binding transcriptional regulator YafY
MNWHHWESGMNIKETIASAGRNLHTIIITAREDDGSIETREAEPYSYRFKGRDEKFFCYDINKNGIRNFHVSSIISVVETNNSFTPRWPVEV